MTNEKRELLIKKLKETYPNPKCELEYASPFQLLVAVVLSAQCTDKRVNEVTRVLFKDYPTSKHIANAPLEVIESIIKPCGFFHNKAKAIISLSKDIETRFGGAMPEDKEQLKTLAGVGEKTANVVVSLVYNQPAIAVDTHVFRVSNRLGLANAATTEKTQKQLEEVLDKDYWSKAHYSLVLHGRYICKARKPNCENCTLSSCCDYYSNLTN